MRSLSEAFPGLCFFGAWAFSYAAACFPRLFAVRVYMCVLFLRVEVLGEGTWSPGK